MWLICAHTILDAEDTTKKKIDSILAFVKLKSIRARQ